MCRLALFNKKGVLLVEKRHGLSKFLTELEESMGGHGNGIAMLKGNNVQIKKGVNLNVKSIARTLLRAEYDWVIFHTRRASAGNISDQNCHPFKEGKLVLAMNGTETWVTPLREREMTDTEAIAKVVARGFDIINTLMGCHSVFVGFYNGIPFVVKPTEFGDLEIYSEGDAVIYASEIPETIGTRYTFTGFHWLYNGILPTSIKEVRKTLPIYYSYGKSFYTAPNYDYDDYNYNNRHIGGMLMNNSKKRNKKYYL